MNYIDLLKCILKNFDGEFDCVIKKILSKIFEEYYLNRNDKIYCIDNLYKKFYVGRYNFIKKKYGVVKNEKLIFRFNRYNKKAYIIKLLKENFRVILDENKTYDKVADDILKKDNIKNYKRYIDNMFIEKEIDRNMKKVCNDNNFEIKCCFYLPCLNTVINNYSNLHNKDMI